MALFAKDWEALSKSNARCFVVAYKSALRLRSSATGSDSECTGKYLRPGQCFIVTVALEKEDTTYLKLADGSGWVFDRWNGRKMVLELDKVELGEYWYTCTSQDFVEVRSAPSVSEDCRSGWIMCPKEVTMVGLRCIVSGHLYLQLQDGRGWLFETQPWALARKNGHETPVDVMHECSADDMELLADARKLSLQYSEGETGTKTAFSLDLLPACSILTSDVVDRPSQSRKNGNGMSCFGFCGRNPAVTP